LKFEFDSPVFNELNTVCEKSIFWNPTGTAILAANNLYFPATNKLLLTSA